MNKLIGIFIVILSQVVYGSLNPLLKKSSEKIAPFTVIAISMFVLFFIAFIGSIIFEKSLQLNTNLYRKEILILIIVGIGNVVGFWLLIQGFKYMPIWQLSMISLLSPIFASIFAYFLLGEAVSPKLLYGLAIMSIGLFVALR